MLIKQIEAQDTYPLRSKILRPGKPLSECYFNGDEEENTFHLGAFVNDELVSIASFYMKNSEQILDPFQFQLRGMATLEEFRGKGFSTALLKTGFPMIKNNHIQRVWCNARVGAIGFYKSLGFEQVSEEFEIADVGTHVVMTKFLGTD